MCSNCKTCGQKLSIVLIKRDADYCDKCQPLHTNKVISKFRKWKLNNNEPGNYDIPEEKYFDDDGRTRELKELLGIN